MNCSLCKLKEIIIDKTTAQGETTESIKIGSGNIAHCHNGNYYCEECYEAMEFAGDMSSSLKKEINKENNTPKPVIKISSSFSTVRCPKCKISYSGNCCPECKTPSPLSRRKK